MNNMFNYSPLIGSTIPFSLPGASVATAAKSGFSFSSPFSGIQKTASTINQIVPLYHNVKPIISNSKTLFTVMKSLSGTPKTQQTVKKEEKKEDIIDIKEEKKVSEEKIEIKSINIPSKPFFS
jgi:hypothetical protein